MQLDPGASSAVLGLLSRVPSKGLGFKAPVKGVGLKAPLKG